MSADDLFGPETDEEKAEAQDHPLMALYASPKMEQAWGMSIQDLINMSHEEAMRHLKGMM